MAFDWKAAIGKIAPWLAGAFCSPVAGVAVEGLCKALGLEPTVENAQKIAEQAAAGKLTGDQFIALQRAEQDFQLRAQELGFKNLESLEEIAFKDRDSARNRQIQLKDKTPQILSYIALSVWALMNGVLLWMAYGGKSLPTDMSPIIMRVLGTMDALLGLAFSFFFGTTYGSQMKNELLHKSTPVEDNGGQK